jgi:hypothetical protein
MSDAARAFAVAAAHSSVRSIVRSPVKTCRAKVILSLPAAPINEGVIVKIELPAHRLLRGYRGLEATIGA